jgi:hypothetical protein
MKPFLDSHSFNPFAEENNFYQFNDINMQLHPNKIM